MSNKECIIIINTIKHNLINILDVINSLVLLDTCLDCPIKNTQNM